MATRKELTGSAPTTADELVARARALVPGLRARQAATERNRQVPQESIDEILAAGLYRILQPRHYGGLEHDLDVFFRVVMEIASGCGSTGWVYATSAQHQWMIGMFPPEAQEDVWGEDRQAIAAATFNPTGVAIVADGGFRLTGNWAYCSGVDNTPWMILGAKVAPAGHADPVDSGYVLIPKSDFTLDDTWDVVGLAGTGSKNVIADDVFVPAHRFLPLADALTGRPPGAEINTGDLFKIPFFAAISICLCAAALGIARGAFDQFVANTRERMTRGAALSQSVRMAEIPTIQLRIGEAGASIDAATLLVERDCRDIMATIAAGRELNETQRARNKGDLGLAVRLAVQAVDRLFEAGGGHGLFLDSHIQRAWRDIHAAATHISMNWDAVGALYGRVTLGQPAGTAQF